MLAIGIWADDSELFVGSREVSDEISEDDAIEFLMREFAIGVPSRVLFVRNDEVINEFSFWWTFAERPILKLVK